MKLKRMYIIFITNVVLISLFIGCSANETTNNDKQKVRILTYITGGKDSAENQLFQQALSDATGLNIEFEKVPSDYDNILMQKIQGGEEYDLIYASADIYSKLVLQDALLDITDKVNSSDILVNNIDPQEWKDITIDGKIYGGFNKKEIYPLVTLNRVHLEEVGIDYKAIEPTLDGYYNVFKTLKEANKNKEKIYYPLNIVLSEGYDIQPWMASVGLKSGVVLDSDGETYVPYASTESKPVWQWLKKLFDEELLDPTSFIDNTKNLRGKQGAASQNTSIIVDWSAWVGIHNAQAQAAGISKDEYEMVSLPGVQTPDGGYMLTKGVASLFAVPANVNNVDGAIKVLEYFATQEGGELFSIGIEGHDYTVENDQYILTDIGSKHANDHGVPFPIYKDFKSPTGYNTGIEETFIYDEYASIARTIPNKIDYEEILGKWAIQIVKGDVSIDDGLANMNKDFISRGITTK